MRGRRFVLTPDKRLLVEQFVKLTPVERLRYAFSAATWALRINPKLLLQRQRLTQAHRGRWRR